MKAFIKEYPVHCWMLFGCLIFICLILVVSPMLRRPVFVTKIVSSLEECKESVHSLRIDYPHAEAVCQFAANKAVIQSGNLNTIYVSCVCK